MEDLFYRMWLSLAFSFVLSTIHIGILDQDMRVSLMEHQER